MNIYEYIYILIHIYIYIQLYVPALTVSLLDLSHCPGSFIVVYTCGAPQIAHDASFLWLSENSLSMGIPKSTA